MEMEINLNRGQKTGQHLSAKPFYEGCPHREGIWEVMQFRVWTIQYSKMNLNDLYFWSKVYSKGKETSTESTWEAHVTWGNFNIG